MKLLTSLIKGNGGNDRFKKVGTGKVPKSAKHLYESKADEYLVAVKGLLCRGSGGTGDDEYYFAFVSILGYVNLSTGKKSSVRASMKYEITPSEFEKRTYFDQFDKLTIYRVRAVASKPVETIKSDSPYYAGLFVLEAAEKNIENEFLQNLIEEYKKPVILHTEGFGDFTLNKDYNFFEGKCDWCGEKIDIIFHLENGKQNAQKALLHFEEMYKDRENWDKKVRDFAAKKLTKLANQWLNDISEEDEVEKITEEKFSGSIKIESISITNRGKLEIYCNDAGFFLGHVIEITGNLKSGLKSANIEG